MCPVKAPPEVLVHSCSEDKGEEEVSHPRGSQRLRESARGAYSWFAWSRLIAAVDKLTGNGFKKSTTLTRTAEKADCS